MIRFPTPQRNLSWWAWAESLVRLLQVEFDNIHSKIRGLKFTDLSDVPDSYTGHAGDVLVVNATEDGLEFVNGLLTKGTTTINFGAFPGSTDTSVNVTGQTEIVAGSTVKAWMIPTATADHSADEHLIGMTQIDVVAGNIVAGTGFTIYAMARHLGTSPLEMPGIGRIHKASTTSGQNAAPPQGVFPSVGGSDLSRQYGQFSVAWEWV